MDSIISVTPSVTTIHRPFGGIVGYRQLSDRASRVSVHAFPMSALPQVSASGVLASPGAYVITDHRVAYVGESGRPARRLGEHAADRSKVAYAREVFVIAGCEGSSFDKLIAVDLQFRLTHLAVDAGVVAVTKGVNPVEPRLTQADRSTHDRLVDDALRLLFDAGCRIFSQPSGDVDRGAQGKSQPVEENVDHADGGSMEIDVATPVGAQEFELRYADCWARGFWHENHFVVGAGSEIRTQTNSSCDPGTRGRRDDLFRAGVLGEVPGVSTRRRLLVALAFSSMSIAAKTVSGAHTAGRWTPLASRSRVVVLEGLRRAQLEAGGGNAALRSGV